MGKAKRLLCGALALLLLCTLCACRTVRLENGETFVITRQAHGASGSGEAEPEQTAAPETTPSAPETQTDLHYYVSRQSAEIQSLFWRIYNAVCNFEERISLPEGTTREQVEAVDELLYVDCPELIHFSHLSSYTFVQSAPDVILEVAATYVLTPEEKAEADVQLDAVLERLAQETSGMSEYQTELYVHDALVNGCTYDAESDHTGSAYGAWVLGRARCQGYANAMMLALRRLGIPCIYIFGDATSESGTESHAWNGVCLEGDWVLVDATWDDPVGERETLSHAYFNLDAAMMNRSHTPSAEFALTGMPEFSTRKWNYCVQQGTFVRADEDGKAQLAGWLAQVFAQGGTSLSVQFETVEQCRDAVENLQAILQVAADEAGVYPTGSAYTVDEKANALEIFSIAYEEP
ncbi:MAG: transglutaminase domain-containing protein [Candidatus Spyradocola sp.]|jgi:transglutaminase-like putative cysteine protease